MESMTGGSNMSTGTSFLDLPPELRNTIYEMAFNTQPFELSREYHEQHPILFTCKLIRQEAELLFYKETCFGAYLDLARESLDPKYLCDILGRLKPECREMVDIMQFDITNTDDVSTGKLRKFVSDFVGGSDDFRTFKNGEYPLRTHGVPYEEVICFADAVENMYWWHNKSDVDRMYHRGLQISWVAKGFGPGAAPVGAWAMAQSMCERCYVTGTKTDLQVEGPDGGIETVSAVIMSYDVWVDPAVFNACMQSKAKKM